MSPKRVALAATLSLLLLTSLASAPAFAQDGGDGANGVEAPGAVPNGVDPGDIDLRVTVTYGFDGIGKPGRWTPVVVRLSNLGDAVHGSIDLRSLQGPRTSTERHPYLIRRDLHIPKGSSEVVRAILPVGAPALPIEVTVRTEAGEVIHRQQIDATSRIAPQALVVSLSDRRILEGLLRDEPGREGIRLRASGPVTVAYPLPEFLPDEWIGYHGADLLFIGRAPIERLSVQQWQAIVEWIDRGGAAVITHPPPGAPGRARITSLWDTAETLPTGDPRAPERRDVLQARSRAAGTLYRLNIDAALLTGRGGAGTAEGMDAAPGANAAVGGDPAAAGAAGAVVDAVTPVDAGTVARGVLRDLALERSRGEPHPSLPVLVRRQPFADPVNQAILDGPIYTYPSRWLIALALIAYLGAFAALVQLLRRGVRGAVPALVAVPVLVAAVLYLVLSVANPPPEHALIEVQRITGRAGNPIVSLERDLLALAATGRSYTLRPPSGATIVPVEGEPNRVRVAEGARHLEGSLPRWREAHYFLADRIHAPVRVEHRGTSRSGVVALRNDTDHLLEDVFLIFSDAVYHLGSLSPGQTTQREYDAALPVAWEQVAPARRAVAELRQADLGPVGSAARREAVFLAMSPNISATAQAEPRFDAVHTFALLELRILVEAEQ